MAKLRCGTIEFDAIAAVLIDKDGTLARSEEFLRQLSLRRARLIDAQVPGVQEPLLMAFGADRSQINPAGLMAVGSRQESAIAAAAYVAETGRSWIDALTLVQSAFTEADRAFSRKAEATPAVEGAQDLLQRLHQAQLSIGVLSSDVTANVQDFLACYGLNPYVHLAMGIDGFLSKLDPLLLRQVVARLEVPPEQILVIGDSQADVQLAQTIGAAGIVGFSGGWMQPVALSQATVTVKAFDEIQVI